MHSLSSYLPSMFTSCRRNTSTTSPARTEQAAIGSGVWSYVGQKFSSAYSAATGCFSRTSPRKSHKLETNRILCENRINKILAKSPQLSQINQFLNSEEFFTVLFKAKILVLNQSNKQKEFIVSVFSENCLSLYKNKNADLHLSKHEVDELKKVLKAIINKNIDMNKDEENALLLSLTNPYLILKMCNLSYFFYIREKYSPAHIILSFYESIINEFEILEETYSSSSGSKQKSEVDSLTALYHEQFKDADVLQQYLRSRRTDYRNFSISTLCFTASLFLLYNFDYMFGLYINYSSNGAKTIGPIQGLNSDFNDAANIDSLGTPTIDLANDLTAEDNRILDHAKSTMNSKDYQRVMQAIALKHFNSDRKKYLDKLSKDLTEKFTKQFTKSMHAAVDKANKAFKESKKENIQFVFEDIPLFKRKYYTVAYKLLPLAGVAFGTYGIFRYNSTTLKFYRSMQTSHLRKFEGLFERKEDLQNDIFVYLSREISLETMQIQAEASEHLLELKAEFHLSHLSGLSSEVGGVAATSAALTPPMKSSLRESALSYDGSNNIQSQQSLRQRNRGGIEQKTFNRESEEKGSIENMNEATSSLLLIEDVTRNIFEHITFNKKNSELRYIEDEKRIGSNYFVYFNKLGLKFEKNKGVLEPFFESFESAKAVRSGTKGLGFKRLEGKGVSMNGITYTWELKIQGKERILGFPVEVIYNGKKTILINFCYFDAKGSLTH